MTLILLLLVSLKFINKSPINIIGNDVDASILNYSIDLVDDVTGILGQKSNYYKVYAHYNNTYTTQLYYQPLEGYYLLLPSFANMTNITFHSDTDGVVVLSNNITIEFNNPIDLTNISIASIIIRFRSLSVK